MKDHHDERPLNSFPFTASLELTESNFTDHSRIWGRSLLSVCHSIFIQILHLTKKEKCTKDPARSIHTCTTWSTWKRFWVYTSIQNCTHTTGKPTHAHTHTHTHTHTHILSLSNSCLHNYHSLHTALISNKISTVCIHHQRKIGMHYHKKHIHQKVWELTKET